MGILEWLLLLLLLLFGGTRQGVSEPILIGDGDETSIDSITAYGDIFFTEDDGWYIFETDESEFGSFSVSWTDREREIVIYIIDYPTPPYRPTRVFNVSWVYESLDANYSQVEFDQACEDDEIYLFEFDLEYRNEPYHALTWIFYSNDRYIRNVSFIFPTERADELDDYAEQFFPDLYACDE